MTQWAGNRALEWNELEAAFEEHFPVQIMCAPHQHRFVNEFISATLPKAALVGCEVMILPQMMAEGIYIRWNDRTLQCVRPPVAVVA